MNPIGDGWKHNSDVSVTERDAVNPKEELFTHVSFDDDETDKTGSPADQSRQRAVRRRKRIVGASLSLLVLIVAGAGFWTILGSGGKTKINVPVRDNAQGTDQAAHSTDDATAQATAEVRSATAAPTPAVSASPVTGTTEATGGTRTIVVPTTPVTIPIEAAGGAAAPPATDAAAGQQGGASRTQAGAAAKSMGIVSERNLERSIRCAPVPVAISSRQPIPETSPNQSPNIGSPVLKRTSAGSVVLPPFGAMLPIRTMGALYTLRRE